MNLARPLGTAAMAIGLVTVGLTACSAPGVFVGNRYSGDPFGQLPKEVPYLPAADIAKSDVSGDAVAGHVHRALRHEVPGRAKYALALSGVGSSVTYSIVRK